MALAIEVCPFLRKTAMTQVLINERFSGALPERIFEASSLKTTSFVQCNVFSMCQ